MLIGVSGVAGAGKDAIAKILVEMYGFRQLALATKMKEAALALDPIIDFEMQSDPTSGVITGMRSVRLSELIEKVGPEAAKRHPEVRRTYQRMGTEVGRNTLSYDLWVTLVFNLIHDDNARQKTRRDHVISDVRFLNEARAVVGTKGGFMIRVVRPGAGLEGEAGEHVSETELNDDTDGIYDEILYNDGTLADLETKVARTLAQITNTLLASTQR